MKRNRVHILLLAALVLFAAAPAMAVDPWVAVGDADDFRYFVGDTQTPDGVSENIIPYNVSDDIKPASRAAVKAVIVDDDGSVVSYTAVQNYFTSKGYAPNTDFRRPLVLVINGKDDLHTGAVSQSVVVQWPLPDDFGAGKKPGDLKVVKVLGVNTFHEYTAYGATNLQNKQFVVISADTLPVPLGETLSPGAGNILVIKFLVSGDWDVGNENAADGGLVIDPLFVALPGTSATPTPTGTITPTPTLTPTPAPTGTITPTPTTAPDLPAPVTVPSDITLPSGTEKPSVTRPSSTSSLPSVYSDLVFSNGGILFLQSDVLSSISSKAGVTLSDTKRLPVFKASVPTAGASAAFAFSFGSYYSGKEVSSMRLLKVTGTSTYLDYALVYSASELTDGRFAIVSSDGKTIRQRGDKIQSTDIIVLVIKDNGRFDMDPDPKSILDPCFLALATGGSSSGGCVTGSFAPAAMLMVIPLLGVFLAGRK